MTNKMKMADGSYIDVPEFDVDDGRIVKVNISRGETSEGVWAWLNPADIEDYRNNASDVDKFRIAVCANTAMCGMPWGHYMPIRFRGYSRPVCEMELIDLSEEPIKCKSAWEK